MHFSTTEMGYSGGTLHGCNLNTQFIFHGPAVLHCFYMLIFSQTFTHATARGDMNLRASTGDKVSSQNEYIGSYQTASQRNHCDTK
mmetsp:Transcript_1074/g.1906  ORF Transcript_1074/g.1906 Transcript_1074/m.1906 type:complete len:86 (+) Transcript_1074:129-386(+)